MLEGLYRLSQNFIKINNRDYVRYFLGAHPLDSRFSIIVGQRGVGKTTLMIQHLMSSHHNDIFTDQALYVQADHFLMGGRTLYEIAEELYNLGGKTIYFGEIHKYPSWSMEFIPPSAATA